MATCRSNAASVTNSPRPPARRESRPGGAGPRGTSRCSSRGETPSAQRAVLTPRAGVAGANRTALPPCSTCGRHDRGRCTRGPPTGLGIRIAKTGLLAGRLRRESDLGGPEPHRRSRRPGSMANSKTPRQPEVPNSEGRRARGPRRFPAGCTMQDSSGCHAKVPMCPEPLGGVVSIPGRPAPRRWRWRAGPRMGPAVRGGVGPSRRALAGTLGRYPCRADPPVGAGGSPGLERLLRAGTAIPAAERPRAPPKIGTMRPPVDHRAADGVKLWFRVGLDRQGLMVFKS